MIHPQPDQKRIVFLFSDTGGGHRSAAEAIIEAIQLEFPGKTNCEMVDVFRYYTPMPLKFAPEVYPPLSRFPEVWGLGYHMSDGMRRTRFFYKTIWPYVRRSMNRFVNEHPADLIVSVHPLISAPVLRAMGDRRTIPFVIVVTDMVSTHAAWYQDKADQIIVPTEAARVRAHRYGIQPEKIQVVGLPVAERFCQPIGDKEALKEKLGWPKDLPVVLLVGGGDGMGPLEEVSRAINDRKLPTALAVVTGRNRKLKMDLEAYKWNIPVYVYGFVREMPELMRASDILVTKAGPGTISEAFIAGLPVILYSRMPGQEDGNVDFVLKEGAGVWAPNPEQAAEAVRLWLGHPGERQRAQENCQRLARPQAARQIARLLASRIQLTHPENG